MKPCGKKKAGTQKELGTPSRSHLLRNYTLAIRSGTQELSGFSEG